MAVKITSDYIDMLNQAVEREFQVSIQYFLQHAKMEKIKKREIPENILLDKTVYDAVGKIFKDISIQEMKHAADIMERIYYLGGQATTKAKKPVIGETISEFAKLGVKAEEEAHLFKFQEYTTFQDEKEEPYKVPMPEWRKIFTKDYFDLLNKAVAAE